MSDSLQPNTSIYGSIRAPNPVQAPGANINPLDMAQQFQQLQRTGLENNQMALQQTARIGIGQAVQQATDPQTGQLDEGKFNALISQDPRTAYMANDIQSAIVARKFQQQQIDTSQLTNGLTVAQTMVGQLGTLANDPNLTKDKVYDVVRQYVAMAPHDQALPIAMNFVKNMPAGDGPQDVAALRTQIKNAQTGFESTAKAFQMALPDYHPVHTAAGTTFVDKNAMTNNNPAAQTGMAGLTVNEGISPKDAITPQAAPMVNGQPQNVLAGTVAQAAGVKPAGSITLPSGQTIGGMMTPPAASPNPAGWGQGPATGGQGFSPGNPLIGSAAGASGPSMATPGNGPQAGGQAPSNPAGPAPQGGTSPQATGQGRPATAAFDPVIPPPLGGKGGGAAAMASGSYQTEPSEAQKAQQKTVSDQWQQGRQDLTQQAAGDQQVTQAISAEQKAAELFRAGPGSQTAAGVAHAIQSLASYMGPGTARDTLTRLAGDVLENPDNPQAAAKAQAAVQFFESMNLQTQTALFDKHFGGGASGGAASEFQAVKDAYLTSSTLPGAKASIYDYAKQMYAYDLAKQQASQIYQQKADGQNGQGSSDWNDFSRQWQQHALKHGFGSISQSPDATVAAPGDQSGLLGSVGLHPQAAEHNTAAPSAQPTYVRGTARGIKGLWQQMPDGTLSLVKRD